MPLYVGPEDNHGDDDGDDDGDHDDDHDDVPDGGGGGDQKEEGERLPGEPARHTAASKLA